MIMRCEKKIRTREGIKIEKSYIGPSAEGHSASICLWLCIGYGYRAMSRGWQCDRHRMVTCSSFCELTEVPTTVDVR